MQVEFDRSSLRVGGQRVLIRAGSLHYFRLPSPYLWRDRIRKMADAGLNAVDLYYPWNYHAPSHGEYDFAGVRDLAHLHDLIEEAGLYLIARPGPYICAEIDMGGLPAWLLQDRRVLPRCRTLQGYAYSREYMTAVRDWFDHVVPTFTERDNLILVQVENEYRIPAPFSELPQDLADLAIRWFGTRGLSALMRSRRLRRWLDPNGGDRRLDARDRDRGQTSPYIRELYGMLRDLGVHVPIFHNDLSSTRGRQMDVDILAVDRYPVTDFTSDWRDRPDTFDSFRRDEAGLDAHRDDNPLFYPELQAGWYDGWGGPGYGHVRDMLGPEGIDNVTKAALAARATLWNYYVFCGGVTWGYMSSPDVYSSYDYGAPIAESGRIGPRYETVRLLNEFLARFESELAEATLSEDEPWCAQHRCTRLGPKLRFVFLENPSRGAVSVPTPEQERAELAPWEFQIRVYDSDARLVAVSPTPVPALSFAAEVTGPPPPPLPRLERWTFSGASPQLDPSYDDSGWSEISPAALDYNEVDIDSLGVYHGFIWYRGTFQRPLDRLLFDARHCYAVWVNGVRVAAGDQFQNTLGVGPDGASLTRVRVDPALMQDGRNVIVILVESLGHNKGFADDVSLRRGLVRLDTGSTPVHWRYRGGLVRGERGMTPVVAFEGVERTSTEEVVLPHGWSEGPMGVGLYETSFRLNDIDPDRTGVGLALDPGRGKANLYLNGYLIGRYWPERGPQRRFAMPWGVLKPDEENHLAVALWKRSDRAALGKIRVELM